MSSLLSPNILRLHFLLLLLLLLLSVAQIDAQTIVADPTKCISAAPIDCSGATNLFPSHQRIKIRYATNSIRQIRYTNTYVDVKIRAITSFDIFKYRIYPCGCRPSLRGIAPDIQVLFIAPNAYYIDDSVIISAFHFLAPEQILRQKRVKFIPSLADVWDAQIRAKVRDNTIKTLAHGSGRFDIDYSRINRASVALALVSTQRLNRFVANTRHVPYIVFADIVEEHPLARAEWIKILGLIVGDPDRANRKFDAIEQRYLAVKQLAAKAAKRPSVFFNYPDIADPYASRIEGRYTWYFLASKRNYITSLTRDASADYRFLSVRIPNTITLNLPATLRLFRSAQHLMHSSRIRELPTRTLDDYINGFVSTDIRDGAARRLVQLFGAVRCANVWNHKRVRPDGADDFFASGVYRPDEVLKDYVQILHPDVDFGSRQTRYLYRLRLPRGSAISLQCPFTTLSNPPTGKIDFDKRFRFPTKNRFEVEDKFDPNLIRSFASIGISRNNVEMFFSQVDRRSALTILTVRTRIAAANRQTFKNSGAVLRAVRTVYGNNVQQL